MTCPLHPAGLQKATSADHHLDGLDGPFHQPICLLVVGSTHLVADQAVPSKLLESLGQPWSEMSVLGVPN